MNHAHLIQGGEIVLSGAVIDASMADWWEDGGFCADQVRAALAEFDGDVTIRLNSYGGVATEGEAIRAAIAGHPGRVRVVVEGVAASAASLLALGAADREMSEGSFWMIHDPSNMAWGTEADLRAEADVLSKIANSYAAIYAEAMGIDREAAREIMRAETWFDADEAAAHGLVTGGGAANSSRPPYVDRAAAEIDFAARMADMGRRVAEHKRAARMPKPEQPAGSPATSRRDEMSKPNTPETKAGTDGAVQQTAAPAMQPAASAPPAPPLDEARIRADAIAADRERARAIRAAAAPFMAGGQVEASFVDGLIDSDVTAEQAGLRILARMAEQQGPEPRPAASGARITRDETETRVRGMVAAMAGQSEGPAEQFRGLRTLRQLALTLSGDPMGYDQNRAIRAGMGSTALMSGSHGISDFAYITTEVMNVRLREAYVERAPSWRFVSGTPISASDFREIHAARFGGDFELRPVRESGEYQSAVLADEAEGLKVERRGRSISITFEAVVNDRVGAFDRLPGEFAREARRMENSMVWALFRDNAKLKSDGKALFHVDHGNLAGSGAVISSTSVAAARKAMWNQKAYGSKASEAFLEIEPNTLIVPPALEEAARQFVMPVAPAKDGDGNPFKSSIDDVVVVPNIGAVVSGGSDTSWYMTASDLPPIAVAYLDGYEEPTVMTTEGMNPDKMQLDARHIFGAAPDEFRGAFKNPGA